VDADLNHMRIYLSVLPKRFQICHGNIVSSLTFIIHIMFTALQCHYINHGATYHHNRFIFIAL
jgi:hypothetical protein